MPHGGAFSVYTGESQIVNRPLLPSGLAAKRLGISRNTLDRLKKAGRITFVMVGGQVRYREEDLDDFVARNVHRGNSMIDLDAAVDRILHERVAAGFPPTVTEPEAVTRIAAILRDALTSAEAQSGPSAKAS